MIPLTYIVPSEKTNPRFGRAFAEGCGGPIDAGNTLQPGSVAMFGSPKRWELLQEAFRQHRTVWYGDHAYMGRGQFYRITRNGYQHDGTGEAPPDRFEALQRPIQPWRSSGRHVLICPNSPTYFRLFGLDVHAWVREIVAQIARVSRRHVKVRWKGDPVPIAEDLAECWAVVAWSSAAAVDALLAGVPVFVLAPFAAAYRMGRPDVTQIESPIYPTGREPFFWNLAANQWTLEEIRSGMAWKALAPQAVLA